MRWYRLALLALLAAAPAAVAGGDPPNWTVSAAGTTHPEVWPQGVVHVDSFAGTSSHLGKFTGAGYHVLDLATGHFVGFATYTAADGSTLDVEYEGDLGPSTFPGYPYGALAAVEVVGGTGRLARASGSGVLTGAFTGIPGDLIFTVQGTLLPHGK